MRLFYTIILVILCTESCSKYVQVRTLQHYKGYTIVEYKGTGYVIDTIIPYHFFWIEKDCLKYYTTNCFKFKNARKYKKFIQKSKCADLLKIGDTIEVDKDRIVITRIETPVNIH